MNTGGGVEDCNGLTGMECLIGLRTINPTGMEGNGSLVFKHNDELTNVAELSRITGRLRALSFYNNPKLRRLAGMGGISSLSWGLEVAQSDFLRPLQGLALTSMDKDCKIWYLPNLETVRGLERLHNVNSFTIQFCPKLVDLVGPESLTKVYKHLTFREVDGLVTLEGPGPIAALADGSFIIEYTESLEDISALSTLQYIQHNLQFEYVPELETRHGPHNLTHIGDRLVIVACGDLDDLDGLGALVHSWGRIILEYNYNLHDVTGLYGLQLNPATGYVCMSFRAYNYCSIMSPCISNASYWAIVENFGGEEMVELEIEISHN